jgi:hypothetical protein
MYPIFYSVVFLTFVYLLYRYQNNLVGLIIILAFYSGLAAYPGRIVENPYKILLLVLSVYVAVKHQVFVILDKRDRVVLMSFLLFTVSFFLSGAVNGTGLILLLSQYGKYVTPLIMFFVFKLIQKKDMFSFIKISMLLVLLLDVQIASSFVKYFTLGMPETTVGSLSYIGGGIATLVPLIGFILIWLLRRGNLKQTDWIFIALLVFVAVVSIKRAIWFVLPITIFLFLFYIPKRKIPLGAVWIILFLPIILYVGARLNPTLNKEGKTWGSFDLNFVTNYVVEYNFGKQNEINSEKKLGEGRGGATLLLFDKVTHPSSWTYQDIFGYGLEEYVTRDYENFDENKFGLNSKGAVTGFFLTYISFGIFGVFFFLMYAFTLINYIKIKRLKFVMFGLFMWEYFFYIGMFFTIPALTITLFYLIVYLNRYASLQSLPIIRFSQKSLLKG